MLRGIESWISLRLKRAIMRSLSILRNELKYLELHLTDHCNLNCKGCTHYSPIAPERYADPHQHEKDMRRLSQLYRTIHTIRLMGGEPLLHPDAHLFIRITRSAFPGSAIRFVTNGILLPQASQAFWDACRDTNTIINLTVYPPVHKRFDDYRSLCEDKGVSLSTRYAETFLAHCNLKGTSQKNRAFNLCPLRLRCLYLQDGRLYPCAMSALVHYFNESFGYKITADKGINIHSNFTSGRKVLMKLSKPIDTCKWCSYKSVRFAWETSNRVPDDWDTEAHRTKQTQE